MNHRLFDGAGRNLIKLPQNNNIIKAMISISSNEDKNSNIDAGFTYLGQLIAHDIVKSTSGIDDRCFDSGKKCIDVRACLMLDSIYGNQEFRDLMGNTKYDMFKFSDPKGNTNNKFMQMDLYRRNNKVIIPDVRNDENYIISQMHLFWQKLHNMFIGTGIGQLCNTNEFNCFDVARIIVVKLFQQVVVEDFLYNLIDIDVYKSYMDKIRCGNGNLFFYKSTDYMETVPLEFSHAAFRFGHSMVRNDYCVNGRIKEPFDLRDLFNSNHEAIHVDKIVDWRRFFGIDNFKSNNINAFKINDVIVNPMMEIPDRNPIIKLNLDAGFNKKLPSASQILQFIRIHYRCAAHELKLDDCQYKELDINNYPAYKNILEGKIEHMPLWLYLLNEAECHNSNSHRLGKLGSVIVAETILKSIQQSEISILNKENNGIYTTRDKLERLDYLFLANSSNPNSLYSGFLNDFRRFKMSDLINFVFINNKKEEES